MLHIMWPVPKLILVRHETPGASYKYLLPHCDLLPLTLPLGRHFIAYAFHRTQLHSSMTFVALYLLQRLKAHFPTAKESSSHCSFISMLMLASKTICDNIYSNKSWCIIGRGMFTYREINQMETSSGSLTFSVDPLIMQDFQTQDQLDFMGPGPYPLTVLPQHTITFV